MTTTLTEERHIVLPKKLCAEKKLQAGDHFEVTTDEDDPNVIVLRRTRQKSKASWVDALLACPEKDWFRPMPRRREPMRKVRL